LGNIREPPFLEPLSEPIFFSYARTSFLLQRKLKNVKSSVEKRNLKKQKEVFKTISIVLVVYALCWCVPNFAIMAATIAGADNVTLGNLSSIVGVGTGLNSSANLFIYAWKHHEIGEHMRKFLRLTNNTSNQRGTSTAQPVTKATTNVKRIAFA
jgi:uncharacterized membrane protein (DUF485 family)